MSFPWIADAHTDFLSRVWHNASTLQPNSSDQGQFSLAGLQQGKIGLQIFALFIDSSRPEHPVSQCLRQLCAYDRMLNVWGPYFILPAELDTLACPFGPARAVLSIEGGEACDDSTELLQLYARLGVRAMSLVWNHANTLAYPALDGQHTQNGLTTQGIRFVRCMNERRIAIDVSHLNSAGFWDCTSYTQAPLFASHSNAYALCPHPRNLTDEQIKALIEQGGYIGLNFNAAFLSTSQSCVQDIVHHALHILDLGGENSLGFGSDFDGVTALPYGLHGTQDFSLILQAFQNAGIRGSLLDKIAHQNLVRYLSQFY